MQKAPNLLLVGGNTRNIGKTTMIFEVIRAVTPTQPLISLKVTSMYKGDEKHHGAHGYNMGGDFEITRETMNETLKDTGKMLRAGATQSYYIQAMEHAVEAAWKEFLQMVPANHLLVCESRSLRRFVEPGLFIYLKSSHLKEEKPYSLWLEELADSILTDPEPDDLRKLAGRVSAIQQQWVLR